MPLKVSPGSNSDSLKRELSTYPETIMTHVTESLKRLAVSKDGHAVVQDQADHQTTSTTVNNGNSSGSGGGKLVSVMSSAKENFYIKYEIIREIGKGGFSIVYQCRDKVTKKDFAAKVVDLRPLRLREKFNPSRLKREVDIMGRLHHPNIIEFIEVYEDPDYLMMIMEYCPGQEVRSLYILDRSLYPLDRCLSQLQYLLLSLCISSRSLIDGHRYCYILPTTSIALLSAFLSFPFYDIAVAFALALCISSIAVSLNCYIYCYRSVSPRVR
jgi:hypothetical protein